MIPEIQQLSEEEKDLLYKSPLLVTILIAGADDNIDKDERESALLSTTFNYQTFVEEPSLENFYKEVTKNFMGKLNKMIKTLPPDANSRNPVISVELEKLNEVLPKLDNEFAQLFYESLRSLAHHVAKASGGFMGMGSISSDEKEWVDLTMIHSPA